MSLGDDKSKKVLFDSIGKGLENLEENECRNPNLAKCGGEAQHLEKLGFGVLWDSRMFRARQQGAKHLALGCSWCHWKGLET